MLKALLTPPIHHPFPILHPDQFHHPPEPIHLLQLHMLYVILQVEGGVQAEEEAKAKWKHLLTTLLESLMVVKERNCIASAEDHMTPQWMSS